MFRKFFILLLFATLAFGGCDKIKMPKFGRKTAAPTPVPVAVAAPKQNLPASPEATKQPMPSVAEAAPQTVNTNASVVVLCYHRFEENARPNDPLAIRPDEFEKQMGELKDAAFTVIPMQDFIMWRRGEKSIPEKSCIVTIDDGYRSGYEKAWPILKKFNYPFTMFIYTNYVKGQPNAGGQSLAWGELAEMRDAGVDIQSHTVSHTNLRLKSGKYQKPFPTYEAWLKHEMADSKAMLEQKLGIAVNCLAYPYGNHSDVIRKVAMECGYEAAFSVYGQRLGYHSAHDQLGRYAIEASKPQIFQAALAMAGGGGGASGAADENVLSMNAAGAMVTQPMEGETITDPKPTIKANLEALGALDPKSVEMRISGIGAVPVKYDPATNLVEAALTQKLRNKNYTVIVSGNVKGRKVQTSWNFNFDPAGAPAPR